MENTKINEFDNSLELNDSSEESTEQIVEMHEQLISILSDKSIHKVAIIDKKMEPKKAEILARGFNEVITKDFIKKFKIIEESASILKQIALSMDKRKNKLPCVIIEDFNNISLVPNELKKNIINVGDYDEIFDKLLMNIVDVNKIFYVFVTENEFDNETHKKVTFDYLMNLQPTLNSNINNLSTLFKIVDKEINYNSFIAYLIDVFGLKQEMNVDIYQTSNYVLKLKNKYIKITNLKYDEAYDGDVILVLDQKPQPITTSFINDQDVNYIYKNYIREPGKL